MIRSHTLGFPRSGAQREILTALDRHARGEIDAASLKETARAVRKNNWALQRDAGLDVVTVGDFALHDTVLNHIQTLGCEPKRFGFGEHESNLTRHFAMARGRSTQGDSEGRDRALQTARWFDSNLHCVTPEFDATTTFTLEAHRLLSETAEAQALGHAVKPVLLGPLTFLWLGAQRNYGADAAANFNSLQLLDKLLPVYVQLLSLLTARGIQWIQIEEPILSLELPTPWSRAFERAYHVLQRAKASLLLATYFGPLGSHLNLVCNLPVAGLHIDAVCGGQELRAVVDWIPIDMVLSIGIIDGRDIWCSDIDAALAQLRFAQDRHRGPIWIAPSCSLQHVPLSLAGAANLESAGVGVEMSNLLAGADRKLAELALLKQILNAGEGGAVAALNESRRAFAARQTSSRGDDPAVLRQIESLRAI